MTPDIDLDAARARQEAALRWLRDGYPYDQNFSEAVLLVRDDVPALLSALTATRAELDERRQHEARIWQRIQAWSDDPTSRLEAFAITWERVEAAERDRDATRAEADKLRALVGDESFKADTWGALPRDEVIRQAHIARELVQNLRAELTHLTRERDEVLLWVSPKTKQVFAQQWAEKRAAPAAAPQPACICPTTRHDWSGQPVTETHPDASCPQHGDAAPQSDGPALGALDWSKVQWDGDAPQPDELAALDTECDGSNHPGMTCDEYDTALEPTPPGQLVLAPLAAGAGDGEQDTATTERAMPVYPCANVGRNIRHMAHVYPVGEAKVVCNGLLPHSVPLNADACLVLVEFGPEPGHSRCCGKPLPCATHDTTASGQGTAGEEGTACRCPDIDVTMPAGWHCPVHGAADQDATATP